MGKQGHDMPEEAPSISEVMEEKLPVDEVMEANTSCLNSFFFTHNWNLSRHCCVVVCFCVFLCGLLLLVFCFCVVFAFGSLCFGSCSSNVTR